MRRIEGTVMLATGNPGKVQELGALLAPTGVAVVPMPRDYPEPVEDGGAYLANARIKAIAAAQQSGMIALADDSGIEMLAEPGVPGVETKPWSMALGGWTAGMFRMYQHLLAHDDHRVRWWCALVVAWPDGSDVGVLGSLTGTFQWPPRGHLGFGFEPVVGLPDGRTLAELDPATRALCDARSDAWRKLQEVVSFGAG